MSRRPSAAGPAPVAATWAGRCWPSGLAAGGAGCCRPPVGRQALVDERVRVIESAGRDASTTLRTRAWQAAPPCWDLLHERRPAAAAAARRRWPSPPASSCGRGAPAPGVRYVAGAERAGARQRRPGAAAGRRDAAALRARVADQPVQPRGAAAAVRRGLAGRRALLGTIELFGLWWMLLLARGLPRRSTGRRARTYVGPLLGVYVGVAAAVAGVVVLLTGGS